jgi:hypothetical protein
MYIKIINRISLLLMLRKKIDYKNIYQLLNRTEWEFSISYESLNQKLGILALCDSCVDSCLKIGKTFEVLEFCFVLKNSFVNFDNNFTDVLARMQMLSIKSIN